MTTTATAREGGRTQPVKSKNKEHPGSSRRADNRQRSIRRVLIPTGTTLTLLVLWEVLTRSGVLPAEVSQPTTIFAWLWGQVGEPFLWQSIGHTLQHAAVGLVIGSAIGIVLGLALGEILILRRLLQGTLEFLRPVPVIVYLPLLILLFGAVAKTAITLVAVAVVWPMLYQTMYGVRAVDPQLIDASRMFGLTARQRMKSITLPTIAPFLATGLRIAMSLALVVSVAIELIAGVPGLGWTLTQYQTAGNYPAVYGVIMIAGALSLILNQLLVRGERRMLHWHVSYRGITK
ncbi:ABC transporter permease [Pseudarthrobacter raffinosi]|uniref:ABC transporter permease n=1 Tax=Pseudarthrobacter raffinosi TaxID=2953651 RepID=UPI00208EAD49|nr:ABC transporter permease [Pseudarthrobacter sp. MDT3-9]MCO4251247.1 ABC transporter permease [Pseudarthrobacter sp. MDT3-9]